MGVIRLGGTLTCATQAEASVVRRLLPAHVAATLVEAGCLAFSVTEAGPLVWRVDETFVDRAAYAAHQARVASSEWGKATVHMARDYSVTEA